MSGRVARFAVSVALATLTVATASACSLEGGGATAPTSSPVAAQASPSSTSFRGVTVSGATGQEPVVLIGDETETTSSIQVQDVVAGSGPVATASTKVAVQYVARGAKTKKTFDSSWDRGEPFAYDPGSVTFSAFVDGVPGMRVGGRRIVIVPGALAFGATPPPNTGLRPDETVVFVIDLLQVG